MSDRPRFLTADEVIYLLVMGTSADGSLALEDGAAVQLMPKLRVLVDKLDSFLSHSVDREARERIMDVTRRHWGIDGR